MAAHEWNHSSWEVEAEWSETQGHCVPCTKLESSVGYKRSWFKNRERCTLSQALSLRVWVWNQVKLHNEFTSILRWDTQWAPAFKNREQAILMFLIFCCHYHYVLVFAYLERIRKINFLASKEQLVKWMSLAYSARSISRSLSLSTVSLPKRSWIEVSDHLRLSCHKGKPFWECWLACQCWAWKRK